MYHLQLNTSPYTKFIVRTNIKLQASEGGIYMCCVTSCMLLTYTAIGVHSDGILYKFYSLTGNIPGY
jgi:hypothetical protein